MNKKGSLKRLSNRNVKSQSSFNNIAIQKMSARQRQNERNPYSESDSDEENVQDVSNVDGLREFSNKFKR